MKNTLRLALAVLFCIVLCLGAGADAWAANCTITFNPNGGYGTMEPQIVTDGGTVTLKANTYYRTNYAFIGWNTKADGSGSAYADREFINIYNFGQTVTLYAQWKYAITFDKGHKDAKGEMDPQIFEFNEPFAINANEFTRSNHRFVGWVDEEGTKYTDAQKNVRMTKSHTLTAQWEKAYYSVTYINPDDNTGKAYSGIPTSDKVKVIECPFEARQGKIFAEWNTVKNPTPTNPGVSYQPGDEIGTELDETTKEPKDITLYAIWKDYVMVYFYPADGTYAAQNVPESTDTKLKTYSALGFKDKTPEGQTFAYWVDAVGTKYFDGQEVNLAENLTLQAVYGNSIDLVYNANGGTITYNEKTGSSLRATIAKDMEYQLYTEEYLQLKRSGYKFLGWALGSGADEPRRYNDKDHPERDWAKEIKIGEEWINNEPITVIEGFSSDTTIYAVWEQLDFEGIVTITGSVTDLKENGLVGETLTADVNGEKEFFDYEYQWLRDGVEIDGATEQTYTVTAEDFEHRITCRVTAVDAKGEKTTLSINYKDIMLDAIEKEIDIIDNLPEDEDDFLYGLTEGMKYSFNSTDPKDRKLVDSKLVTINGVKAFPFFEQGIYRFYDSEGTLEQGSLIAIVEVRNWWSLSYSVTNRVTSSSSSISSSSSSSSYSSGSGTVRMYNGGTQLTASSNIWDKNGNAIIKGTGANSWLVREGVNTDLKIVVTPTSGSYGHISLNSGDYSSSVSERTIPMSPITEPTRFEIVFSREANYPPVPIAAIDEENFPDPAFRQYVSTSFDRDGDGMLYDSEIANVRNLYCSDLGIGSLKGIEYFTALQSLYCANNSLTSLDMLNCPMLTYLSCNGNALTSLDLSGCPALSTLYCSDNVLTELDLSACPMLTDLQCSGNLLITIDLSGNPQLRTLYCNGNLLGSLRLDSNSALSSLYCHGNLLTELNLSGKTALISLDCNGNLLSWLEVSGCVRLRTLNCEENELAELDLSGCEALSTLNCYGNMLSALDLSDCAGLRRLSCANNSLTSIDVSGYSLLTMLTCQDNGLTELHVNNCPALKTLTCQRNALTELDTRGCDALLTLMGNVDPVIEDGVVRYGLSYPSSAILSFDDGIRLFFIPETGIILPAGLTDIEPEAFAGSEFDSLYIPDSVTTIAEDAFGDRTSLTIIGVPGSTAEVFAQAHGFDFVPAA